MTPDELQTLLDAHDVEGCIALFAGATEPERRKLAKTAAAQLRKVVADVPIRFVSFFSSMADDQLAKIYPAAVLNRGALRVAQVAVLATATLTELKKFNVRTVPPVEDTMAVLSTRRPLWVGDWAEMILSWGRTDHSYSLADDWRYVRRLIRGGLCDRLRGASYLEGMLIAFSSIPYNDSIRNTLLDDPTLLDDEIWEIFESEPTRGMLWLLPLDPSIAPERRLEVALAGLADEGRLSRDRLLDACLNGLERDFHEARARWFALMHDTLRPTLEERVERAGRYLGLAASRNPSTVTFAVRTLAALEKAGRLESGPLVDAIGPVLLARAKGTVNSALTLIDSAAARDPRVRSRAAVVTVDALAHESPAVHEAVIDLIERHGNPTDHHLADLLGERISSVAASQRARLEAWLGNGDAAPKATEQTDAGLDDLLARAEGLDPWIAERAGVSAALDVLKQGGGDVTAVGFTEMEAPRLDPARLVRPVADLDELIGLFSAVMEDPNNADDLERVLDGVSRLCDRVPDDFAARTGPLRVRSQQSVQAPSSLVPPLCGLALSWTTGRLSGLRDAKLSGYFVGIFARRVLAIAQRAARREGAPLLGAPTHEGGWIDPRVLVERVKAWASLPYRSDRLDGSLALLRLAPDPGPRGDALRSAAGLEGHFASALRHALGGEGEVVGPDVRIWIAAARARSPRENDLLVEARHPSLGPDAGYAARCTLRPGPHSFANWLSRSNRLLIATEPPLPAAYDHDLPTVLLHDKRAHMAARDSGWVASVWPLGRDSFFAAGSEWLLGYDHTPNDARYFRPFLDSILDPDVPLRPLSLLLLVGTLSANTPELQGLATDALIAAIDDGRIDGSLLSEAIHRLITDMLAKPARLTRALGDAAQISPLHTRVVAMAIQLSLVGLSPPSRDLHLFLELLKELLVESREPLSVAGIEDFLRGLKVSGKTAKLSRDLLGLVESLDPSGRLDAVARALVGRLERAERWTRRLHEDSI